MHSIKLIHMRAGALKCKSTGCLGMCGQGPVVGIEETPGGAVTIYRDVSEESLKDIYAEALGQR
jgi:(2Fe-2S) ferredoxin